MASSAKVVPIDADDASAWPAPLENAGPRSTMEKVRDAMVAARKGEFEDVVRNKMGCVLICDAVISFLAILIGMGYVLSVVCRAFEFLLADADVKEHYEAKDFFCPFGCFKEDGEVDPGYTTWTGCFVGALCSAGYYVYCVLGNGFTDFRQELVCFKTQERDKEATIEGTFYEDIASGHFFSEMGDSKLALMTKAKFIGKCKGPKMQMKSLSVSVEFDDTAQQKMSLAVFDDPSHDMRNAFKEKLDAKVSQPIAEKAPVKESVPKSSSLPQRYMDDGIGSAVSLVSGGGTKVETIQTEKGLDFLMTYIIMVLGTLIFCYVISKVFALIELVFNQANGTCKKEHAIRDKTCDLATILSPVPLVFKDPGDYLHLIYVILTTLGTFVWWYFAWPDHYDFYQEGVVEVNKTLSCLKKWIPTTASVVLYQDAISAAPGVGSFQEQNFQVKTSTIYKMKVFEDGLPGIVANLNVNEALTYEIGVSGPLRDKVSSVIQSSKPSLFQQPVDA